MAAPKVYRFDDNGAPVLSGADNTKLIALLKACLVDGYGSKPGAGWTMPFIDAAGTTAAFRGNPTNGTGFFLQVSPNGTYTYSNTVRGYESMTDENTGILPFYPDSSQSFIFTSDTSNSTARPWIVIADDMLFYLIIWFQNTFADFGVYKGGHMSVVVFGDAIPRIESDNYFCVLFSPKNSNYYYTQAESISSYAADAQSSTTCQYVARNIAGDINDNTKCNIVFGGGPCPANAHGRRSAGYGMDRTLGGEIMSRPYINNGSPYTFRGYLPGLWTPCHKVDDFNVLEQVEIGTHRFLVFPVSRSNDSYLFAIDVSEHWRP